MNNRETGNVLVGSGVVIALFLYLLTQRSHSLLYGIPFVLLVLGCARWFASPTEHETPHYGFKISLILVLCVFWLLQFGVQHLFGIKIDW